MEKKPSVMAWLFGAGLCMGLLPDLAAAVCAAGKEEPLSGAVILGIGLVSACACLLCFMRAIYIRFGKDPENKPDWSWYLAGLFPCLLVCLAFLYGSRSVVPVLTAVYAVQKGVFAGVVAALSLAALLLTGVLFFCYLNGCRKTPSARPVRCFFSRIYLGLPAALLLWLAIFAMPCALVLVGRLCGEPGNLLRHAALLFGALAAAAFLNMALALAEKMMTGLTETPEQEERAPRKRLLFPLVSLFLCLFLFFSQNMPQLTGNEAAQLEARLKESLVEYGLFLSAYDINGAAGIAGEAAVWMDEALLAAKEEEKEAANDPAALRKAEKKTKKLQRVCERYEIFRSDGQALAYIDQYKRAGGASEELAEDVLTLSEEYPENLQAQYAAALIGCSLTYDGAEHYDRTAKAVLRWEKLYLEERNPEDEERMDFEKNTARMLMKIYHEEEAAKILEKIADTYEDTEVWELLAKCYDRTGRQEEAYELAKERCEAGTDSPYLLYYAALSALKLGKTEESLTYTSKLASHTLECEGEELKKCDVWLFELMEFLVLEDSSQYTEFQYPVYEDLTEEQNAFIDENPFFRNYLDAAYLAYGADDKRDPAEGFEKIGAVLERKPELASAWYLRGVIASNTDSEKYMEEAVEMYQKAGELNSEIPAVWYAMAREYDRLEEYESGIEACRRALALLPEQDHGSDWYGIHFHCSRLLDALEKEVEK